MEGRSVFLGGITNPRRGSKPARIGVLKEPSHRRAEFFALPSASRFPTPSQYAETLQHALS